jgi:hypothetical protein
LVPGTVLVDAGYAGCVGPDAQIQFEHVRYHHDDPGTVEVLRHRVFQRVNAINEETAVEAGRILDDPVAAAVPADQEKT